MAATATIRCNIEVDGLGVGADSMNVRYQDTTAPEEMFKGYMVIGTTTTNLDLGGIDDQDIRGVLIKAVGDAVGVLVNDVGTGTPSTSVGNMLIPENGFTYIPFAGGLTDAYYIRMKGAAADAAIEYFVYGIQA